MLTAFLTPDLRDRVLEEHKELRTSPRNCWLVRRSAAAAFTQGYFQCELMNSTQHEVRDSSPCPISPGPCRLSNAKPSIMI